MWQLHRCKPHDTCDAMFSTFTRGLCASSMRYLNDASRQSSTPNGGQGKFPHYERLRGMMRFISRISTYKPLTRYIASWDKSAPSFWVLIM